MIQDMPIWIQTILILSPLAIAITSMFIGFFREKMTFERNLKYNNNQQDRILMNKLYTKLCDIEINFRKYSSSKLLSTIKKLFSERFQEMISLFNVKNQYELLFEDNNELNEFAEILSTYHDTVRKELIKIKSDGDKVMIFSEEYLSNYPYSDLTEIMKKSIKKNYNKNSIYNSNKTNLK